MGKLRNRSRAKSSVKDFVTPKSRLGKKKVQLNQTNADVRAKPVKVIEQKPVTRYDSKGGCVTTKNLTLGELVSQTNHHNANARRDAFSGILELLGKYPEALGPHLGHVLVLTSKSIADVDESVRKQYRAVLEKILVQLSSGGAKQSVRLGTRFMSQRLTPFIEQLGLQLRSCMTHRDVSIRADALAFVELFLSTCALDLPIARRILFASVVDGKSAAADVSDVTTCFLSLATFLSDLYERCVAKTVDLIYLVHVFRVTRIALALLGLNQSKTTAVAHEREASFCGPALPLKMSNWLASGAEEQRQQSMDLQPVHRLLEGLLVVWSTLREMESDKLSSAKSHRQEWDRMPAEAVRLVKGAVFRLMCPRYQLQNTTRSSAQTSSRLTLEDVWLWFPLIIRRDLSTLLVEIFKFLSRVSQEYGKTLASSSDTSVLEAKRKGGCFAQSLPHRFVSGVFADLVCVKQHPANVSVAFTTAREDVRLKLFEAFGWFLNEPVIAGETLLLFTMALCIGLFSAAVLDLSQFFVKDAASHCSRQFYSTIIVYLGLLSHTLRGSSARLAHCVAHFGDLPALEKKERCLRMALGKVAQREGVLYSQDNAQSRFSCFSENDSGSDSEMDTSLLQDVSATDADVSKNALHVLLSQSLETVSADVLRNFLQRQLFYAAEHIWRNAREREGRFQQQMKPQLEHVLGETRELCDRQDDNVQSDGNSDPQSSERQNALQTPDSSELTTLRIESDISTSGIAEPMSPASLLTEPENSSRVSYLTSPEEDSSIQDCCLYNTSSLCLVPILFSLLGVSEHSRGETSSSMPSFENGAFERVLAQLRDVAVTSQSGATVFTHQLELVRSPVAFHWLVDWIELAGQYAIKSPTSACSLLHYALSFVKASTQQLAHADVIPSEKDYARDGFRKAIKSIRATFFADTPDMLFLNISSQMQRVLLLLWNTFSLLHSGEEPWTTTEIPLDTWITVLKRYPSKEVQGDTAFLVCDMVFQSNSARLLPWKIYWLEKMFKESNDFFHNDIKNYCSTYNMLTEQGSRVPSGTTCV